ncbi:MAG TPA: AAA family ATPase, partial [Ilumatobacteraceae bacterium]|nr:AAA family ATPase [Ilumatobacteraceae bacterium]
MGAAGSDQRLRSGRSGSERSKRSSSVDRFVGRANEIAALTSALPATRPTGAVLWTVAGPAGIGKTTGPSARSSTDRQELAQVAVGSGHRVVWGQCWDEAGTPPYWPWTQVIRQLRGNPIGVDLGSFVQPDAGPVDRFALFDATAVELRAAAAEVPLVVVLDDLHHSDSLSLMLTRFVLAHLSDAPLLVVAAYRPNEAAARSDIIGHLAALRDDANELNLSGLDLDGVRELVGDTLRADDVHTLTGGNPLFVEQIVRSAECPVAGTSSAPVASAGHAALLSAVTARLASVDAEVL